MDRNVGWASETSSVIETIGEERERRRQAGEPYERRWSKGQYIWVYPDSDPRSHQRTS